MENFIEWTLRSRRAWRALGYRVPATARPAHVQSYWSPRRGVMRHRALFSFMQVETIGGAA